MSITELKQEIISLIEQTEDEKLLQAVLFILKNGQGEYPASQATPSSVSEGHEHYGKTVEVYHLSEEEKAAVKEAREQYERGEILSAEEAESDIESLLMLTEEQKDSVRRGLKDFEEGRFLTTEELEKSLDKWLKD
jgi:predicted transcriptional regulator